MVVKHLLQMSDDSIILLTPLATLVFSGLPGCTSEANPDETATIRVG
jgi:hypothetical protein